MSILDLQGLASATAEKKGTPGSRASQGCGGQAASTLSLLCNFP
jgi:hypothetical protein